MSPALPGRMRVLLSHRGLLAKENTLHKLTRCAQMGVGQGQQEEGVVNLLFLLLLSFQK